MIIFLLLAAWFYGRSVNGTKWKPTNVSWLAVLRFSKKKQPDLTLENLLPGNLVLGRLIQKCSQKKPLVITGTEWNITGTLYLYKFEKHY